MFFISNVCLFYSECTVADPDPPEIRGSPPSKPFFSAIATVWPINKVRTRAPSLPTPPGPLLVIGHSRLMPLRHNERRSLHISHHALRLNYIIKLYSSCDTVSSRWTPWREGRAT